MTKNFLIEKYIDDDNVRCIYRFGSIVYNTANEDSDEDFIIIAKEYFETHDINIHCYTIEQFQSLIDIHEIQTLECLFLKAKDIIIVKDKIKLFNFNLDKTKLRTSISTISSNSWVKGKKKIIVLGDYDLNAGLKSIFHSLRILDYGIQIASTGKIYNYESMNYVLSDIIKLSKEFKYNELWEAIDTKYRKLFNSKSTEFKLLCPKDLTEATKKLKIKNLLEKYNIHNEDLLNELVNI
jgi:hypothetical protein